MRKTKPTLTFLFVVILLVYFSQLSIAQYSESPQALSVNMVGIDYYSPFKSDFFNKDFITWGTKIAYHRNLGSDALNLEIPVSIGGAIVPDIEFMNSEFTAKQGRFGIGGLLQLQYFKKDNFIVPYLSAGATASYVTNGGFHVEIPLGVGLDFKIKNGWYFQLRPEYRLGVIDDNRDNYNLNIGFKWFINKAEEEPPVDNDRDKDGVLNANDKCPDVAGLATLGGCPDTDSDGIADKDDDCPTVAGIDAFKGCPDTDGDGIKDSDDDCPTEAGSKENNGCPDTDGDGIIDKEDDCKDTPGIPAFNGCPDTDGDGIKDSDDDCPEIAGLAAMKGCPDTDGDGLRDADDKCPTEAGPISNQGCPEITEEVKEVLEFAAQNIQFATNSSTIRSSSHSILDQVADILKQYPAYNVSIEGHTDSQGNENYNQNLSERRAQSCLDYLTSKGIDKSRMSSSGFGETQPIGDNKTSSGRQLNRRVVFNVSLR